MNKQIFQNRWFIWALAVIVIVGFGVWGFIEYSNIQTENELVQINRHRESVRAEDQKVGETKESGQINQVSIANILSNLDQYLNKRVQLEEKFCGWGQTTGSAGPLFTRSDWCICQNPQKKAEKNLTVTGAALPVGVSPGESESIGEILSITGVVKKTSNNIPYIEAEKIVKE